MSCSFLSMSFYDSARFCLFVFFKQEPADEMRIMDWSSGVCSSDLAEPPEDRRQVHHGVGRAADRQQHAQGVLDRRRRYDAVEGEIAALLDHGQPEIGRAHV